MDQRRKLYRGLKEKNSVIVAVRVKVINSVIVAERVNERNKQCHHCNKKVKFSSMSLQKRVNQRNNGLVTNRVDFELVAL